MPKLWNFRDSQTGAAIEEPPENPWLRPPQGIAEQIQHGEAMQQIQDRLRRELLATRRFVDLKPPPREERRLRDLYEVDKAAPGAEALLPEVADAAEDARNRCWAAIMDRLEAAYRRQGG